jgi:hypothetical protein
MSHPAVSWSPSRVGSQGEPGTPPETRAPVSAPRGSEKMMKKIATATMIAVLCAASLAARPANPGGNCDLASDGYEGTKLDMSGAGEYIFEGIVNSDFEDEETYTVVATVDGNRVDFAVHDGDGAIDDATVTFCVKGSNTNSGAQTDDGWTYTVEVTNKKSSVTSSVARDISNIVVYSVTLPEPEVTTNLWPDGRWCSPGFWKNHPDDWPAGYDDTTLFSAKAGDATAELSPKGVRDGATTDPTLRYILDNNNQYTGETYNLVADILSDAHDDVNFMGHRVGDVEDEDGVTHSHCPL